MSSADGSSEKTSALSSLKLSDSFNRCEWSTKEWINEPPLPFHSTERAAAMNSILFYQEQLIRLMLLLSPIRLLPEEILARILAMHLCSRSATDPRRLSVLTVCRSWRKTALSHHQCWSTLILNLEVQPDRKGLICWSAMKRQLKQQIKHARGQPIHLSIRWELIEPYEADELCDYWGLLFLDDWFEYCEKRLSNLLDKVDDGTLVLRSFEEHVDQTPSLLVVSQLVNKMADTVTQSRFNTLTHLMLHGNLPTEMQSFSLPKLVSMTLQSMSVLAVFQNMAAPLLQSLTLVNCFLEPARESFLYEDVDPDLAASRASCPQFTELVERYEMLKRLTLCIRTLSELKPKSGTELKPTTRINDIILAGLPLAKKSTPEDDLVKLLQKIFPKVVSFTSVNEHLRFFRGWSSCLSVTVACGNPDSPEELAHLHDSSRHVQQLQLGIETRHLPEYVRDTYSDETTRRYRPLHWRMAIDWLNIPQGMGNLHQHWPNLTHLVLVEILIHPLKTLIDFLSYQNEAGSKCALSARHCSYSALGNPGDSGARNAVLKRFPNVDHEEWSHVSSVIQVLEEAPELPEQTNTSHDQL